ncbi:hypothetical protein IMG5_123900 [Ichthyophthirius multifiliis]|uniref:MSP domain-containing protein n=1 Tax=Ichthyophthirius multifiliis TaxID=5932 RepID=G0QVI2_ICHMU|nr:hypothetical protein IMG5_123900 [Ichthyophthirius multifiliis]EGR30774.1 hypothetical protein IMG5_123900 [Ichthyophthirius multifiliis]|eukprot:XP_004032361.1 hypothetical protein IMG5_123900 [Ichthyophthirius multifiliis]
MEQNEYQNLLKSISNKNYKELIHKPIQTDIQDSIDFGFQAVYQSQTRKFYLQNPNEYPIDFNFESKIFHINPQIGKLMPKQVQQIQIQFTPFEASALVSTVILNIEKEDARIIKISGVGKYVYLQLSSKKVNFGKLLIGKSLIKQISIKNISQVQTEFTIQKKNTDENIHQAFFLDAKEGQIPGNSIFLLNINFKPQLQDLVYIQHWEILFPGGNPVEFSVIGEGEGFDVFFDVKSVNFGEIKIGNQQSKLVKLYNNSDMECRYQIFNELGNVFQANNQIGVIKGKSHVRILILFQPINTICYYERIFCVLGHKKILFLDVLGTCYDLLFKPLPIVQNQIDNFRQRIIEGRVSFIDFKYMENSILLKISGEFKQKQQQFLQQNSQFNNKIDNFKEGNRKIKNKDIYSQNNFLDFDYQDFMSLSQGRQISIKNNMNCNITIFWTTQKQNSQIDNHMSIFSVRPESATIKENQSFTFEISFRPIKNNFYFYQSLQFFAYKYSEKLTKNMADQFQKSLLTQSLKFQSLEQQQVQQQQQNKKQNLRYSSQTSQQIKTQNNYISDETIPPFCGYLYCIGHSFANPNQIYIPIIHLQPEKVYFNNCRLGETTFQTFEIHNKSDTPVFFRILKDQDDVFQVFPQIGLIYGKSFCIVSTQFQPKESQKYETFLQIQFNHQSDNLKKVFLQAFCSKINLKVENEGKLFFSPCFLGVKSKQKFNIWNNSLLNLNFFIEVPPKYSQELFFEPQEGVLKSNEKLAICCSFIPQKKKKYKIKPTISAYVIENQQNSMVGVFNPGSGLFTKNQEEEKMDIQMEVQGEGNDGNILVQPRVLDFKIVKVNFSEKKSVQIQNMSDCTFFVFFKLVYDENQEEKEEKNEFLIEKNFKLDIQESILAAHSKIDLNVYFFPIQVNKFNLKLQVYACNNEQNREKLILKDCIFLKAVGNYPLLKIIDVRNDVVSVTQLWQNFQINKINQELGKDLNENEIQFLNIEQLNIEQAQKLQKSLKNYTWNFGYLSNKKSVKPRIIVVTIQNTGGTELDYHFKLPSDSQIDVEPWADPGKLQEEDAYERAIVEKKIFQIIPKFGTLKPMQLQDIQLIYSPGNVEDDFSQCFKQQQEKSSQQNQSHVLRVVLQIFNGKPLVINLKGTTLSPNQGMLTVKKKKIDLPDCPIGMIQPIKYPIEIQNVGSTKISYQVDIQEINQNGENIESAFNTFSVSNPEGSLNPNERSYLYCQFKPSVAKKYYHILVIKAQDYMKPLKEIRLTISGQGYANPPPKKIKSKDNEIPQQRSSVSPIGSKCCFSIEEIDFGLILPNKPTHRIIILYNLSKDTKLTYDFTQGFCSSTKTPGLVCDDMFIIDPPQGQLQPEEFIELKLTLEASIQPSIYEGEIECTIYWGNYNLNNNQFKSSLVSQNIGNIEKETLFFRIKKESKLDINQNISNQIQLKIQNQNDHQFVNFITSAIDDILIDNSLFKILQRLDKQPIQLYKSFDDQDTFNENQNIHIENLNMSKRQTIDFKNQRLLFLNQPFLDLVDLIFENTYFNIIQETTRKECDLLKLSKNFIIPKQ